MSSVGERLSRRIRLTDREIAYLESLSAAPFRVSRGELIQSAGLPAVHAFMLLNGWAMTFSDFPDGSRQSRRLHFPGDILAFPSMAMRHHAENIEALTDAVVAPFGRSKLTELFAEYPRLAAVMFIFTQEERITFGDRLCSLARFPAKARMAFLLMDILTRLRAADSTIADSYEMHLTRSQMGEVTGMTPVHASRMWSELISDGLIAFENRCVTIRDEKRLMELSGFSNRSSDLDLTWVP
jgi:CRP/FNR family transcriptional regulator, anaerobic regulatory protein